MPSYYLVYCDPAKLEKSLSRFEATVTHRLGREFGIEMSHRDFAEVVAECGLVEDRPSHAWVARE